MSAPAVLKSAHRHCHFVQLYDGKSSLLTRNVGAYLSEGLKQLEAAIVVATPEHSRAFCRELEGQGIDVKAALEDELLLLLDARETLARFMLNGRPDWELFNHSVGASVRDFQSRAGRRGVRAYGEMVGVLWGEGRFSAAMVLEEYWNAVLVSVDFRLFCAYPIDVFANGFHACDVDALLCSHTHLLPGEANGPLENSLDRAMGEVLGEGAGPLKDRMRREPHPFWPAALKAEAQILWLRANVREQAAQILRRARQYYYASAA